MASRQPGTPPEVLEVVAADQPLLRRYGMEFVQAAHGRAVIRATAAAEMVNARGLVHGGLAYSMADVACAYALRSIGPGGATLNASLTYLKGARPGMALEAVAEVVKAGARTASLRAEVRSPDALLAHGIFNFMLAAG